MTTDWSAADLRRLHRSVMFVPGDDQRKIERARTVPADVVIVDLEDAVAPARKVEARQGLADAVAHLASRFPVLVRVNDPRTDEGAADVAAARAAGAVGIVVPKVDSPEQLLRCAEQAGDQLALVPLIESALGVTRLPEIVDAAFDLPFAALGLVDLATDLNLGSGAVDDEGGLFDHVRSTLVLHSRAVGLGAPVDGPEMRVRDLERFRKRCERARSKGLGGILCLHPSQVEVANDMFAPTVAEVDHARRIVAAFDRSVAEGDGALTVDGEFVDVPVAERSRALVAQADDIARRAERAVQ